MRVGALILVVVIVGPAPAHAQELGQRLLGTLGARAGEQPSAGLYVSDRFLYYGALTVRDRGGDPVYASDPDGPRVAAFANGFGLSATFLLDAIATYVSFGAALPFAYVAVRSDRPEASFDRAGLGDAFLQPIGLGWRFAPHVDVIARYALYVPAGIYRLGSSPLARGQLTHQLGVGATAFFDSARRFRVSARVSYDLSHTKTDIDIRRGDVLQIQGGVGALLFDLLDVGLVGAALWQVRDDVGTDLPPGLRGARERAFGVGAEVGITVTPIAGRVTLRYLNELEARARTEGHILSLELVIQAWQPEPPGAPNTPQLQDPARS